MELTLPQYGSPLLSPRSTQTSIMKTSLRDLLRTEDNFEDDLVSISSKGSKRSRMPVFGLGGARATRRKKRQEVVRMMKELREERAIALDLEERLRILFRDAVELREQAEEEHRLRLLAEAQVEEAKAWFVKVEKALLTAQQEKDAMEAELMEAANSILAQQAVQEEIQGQVEENAFHPVKAAWELVEQHSVERALLESRLEESELQRKKMQDELDAMVKQLPASKTSSNESEAGSGSYQQSESEIVFANIGSAAFMISEERPKFLQKSPTVQYEDHVMSEKDAKLLLPSEETTEKVEVEPYYHVSPFNQVEGIKAVPLSQSIHHPATPSLSGDVNQHLLRTASMSLEEDMETSVDNYASTDTSAGLITLGDFFEFTSEVPED